MKNAQTPKHFTLNTLLSRIREGRFVIPDFQREFAWKAADVRELMRSLFLDYYIGSLLLWKGKKENFQSLSCEPIEAFTGSSSPEHIVLDGQQRLTALHYALIGPDAALPKHASRAFFFVHVDKFMDGLHDEAFDYNWESKAFERLMADQPAQFERHIFPLSVMGKPGWELGNWVQGYVQYWTDKAADKTLDDDLQVLAAHHTENAKQFSQLVKELMDEYQISYIELDEDLKIDKVCDIFTQINSKGVKLTIFDLMNALLKPSDVQLKHMWRQAAERIEFSDIEKMNVYVLQVMSILRQAYCSPKYLYFLLPGAEKKTRDTVGASSEVLIDTPERFTELWNQAVDALEATTKALQRPQEYGVTSAAYLPYASILPALAALQFIVKQEAPEGQLSAQKKVKLWYWAAVFTSRYSSSAESTSARDFQDIRAWIRDDALEPSLIKDFKSQFNDLDLRSEIRKGSSVYNGIFNLLVMQGARDWVTGTIPSASELDDHHIIPSDWGKKHLKGKLEDTILNRAPLLDETNRTVINKRLPNEYLPDWIARNGEDEVRAILESHFISPKAFDILLRNPFSADDFEGFITERQQTIFETIETLVIKERLDLPPKLRELDKDIEGIELALRALIQTTLSENDLSIPGHVADNIRRKVDRASKRDPNFDLEFYETLEGRLEYADLRELQDTFTGKALWSYFQNVFSNRETLALKFNQLADLRNGIRHARQVSNIAAKEGEAAILWFQKVLGIATKAGD